MDALHRGAQVLQHGEEARLLRHRHLPVGGAADGGGEVYLRDGAVLGDDGPEQAVLLRHLPVLGEEGVVVVAGHVGLQARAVVGAVHKAEAGAAVEHVEVDAALGEDVVQRGSGLRRVPGDVLGVAPVVEPPQPELHAHQGPLRLEGAQGGEALRRLGAEVHRGVDAPHRAAPQALVLRAVGGDQGDRHPQLTHQVPGPAEIGGVVGVGAVLVLHLHEEHRSAAVRLEGDQLLHQHPVVVRHMGLEPGVGDPEAQAVLRQEPRREAPQLPLRADVGGGAEDHVQPQVLGGADEALHVQHPVEAEGALYRLVEVPGDVGLHRVAAHGLELLQPVPPVLRHHPEVVDGPGDDLEGRAVQAEGVFDLKCHHFSSLSKVKWGGMRGGIAKLYKKL